MTVHLKISAAVGGLISLTGITTLYFAIFDNFKKEQKLNSMVEYDKKYKNNGHIFYR